ncbi:MAG TPA: hypothetical protein VNZ86_13830 [Bacteroidia bacterium]|jgi:hypothetical protein|nr:hypothetical protein [Bacteroidia bacterium]
MPELLTFHKFFDKDQAMELAELLDTNEIPFEVVDHAPETISMGGSSPMIREIVIKLRAQDFTKANELLEGIAQSAAEQADSDHYLYAFEDLELIEILKKPDEWGKNDYALAQKILKERGLDVDTELVGVLKKERLEELAKPEDGQRYWITVGYAFAIGGGLLGMFMGWHLLTYRKTLPDGKQVYAYDAKSRKHGKKMFIIGIIVFVTIVLIRIVKFLG